MVLSCFKIDDHSGDGRRNAEFGGPHSDDGSAIHRQALPPMSQLTPGEIEYQAVGMIERAHLGLRWLTERHFHSDTVSALGDRYCGDYWMRIVRPRTSGVLRNSGRRSQAGQKQ